MSRTRPSFPPDVARALQRPAGEVSFRYTWPAPLAEPPTHDMPLMETPYEDVLAALTLDTKLNLRFIRTGSRSEGARVALVNVEPLVGRGGHWDISLRWDALQLELTVRDQHDPESPVLVGVWPA